MTADLKAARARVEEAIKDALNDHQDWLNDHLDEPDHGPDEACVGVGALQVLLTALDQAAEALKPIAAKLVDIGQDEADDDHFSNARSPYNQAVSVKVGDVRRAATVYATLKPEGGE